jgi:hypothetical protein
MTFQSCSPPDDPARLIWCGAAGCASTVSLVFGPTLDPATFHANVAHAANSTFDQGHQLDLLLIC